MRWPAFLVLTAVLVCTARPARAETLLYLDSDPEDPVGSGQIRLISSVDGAFGATAFYDYLIDPSVPPRLPRRIVTGVGVQVSTRCTTPECVPQFWSLMFSVPGGPFGPGTYERATRDALAPSGAARMAVSGPGSCPRPEGRFVVHEIVTDAVGDVLGFAADFEQRCDGAGASLRGAIRVRAGNAACAGTGDGASCNDWNPCTQADACQAGVCGGSAPGPCSPLTCDDQNACTEDRLEAAGCVHVPAQSCWTVETRSVVVVEALGRRCGCRLPAGRGVLALGAEGSFRIPGARLPGGAGGCPSGRPVRIPDEVGTWQARGRRMVLRTSNLDDVLEASARCAGGHVNVQGYRTRVRISRDRTRLRGTSRLRARTSGVPITLTTRLEGTPGSGEPEATPSLGGLATAAQRCGRKISACLRR